METRSTMTDHLHLIFYTNVTNFLVMLLFAEPIQTSRILMPNSDSEISSSEFSDVVARVLVRWRTPTLVRPGRYELIIREMTGIAADRRVAADWRHEIPARSLYCGLPVY